MMVPGRISGVLGTTLEAILIDFDIDFGVEFLRLSGGVAKVLAPASLQRFPTWNSRKHQKLFRSMYAGKGRPWDSGEPATCMHPC